MIKENTKLEEWRFGYNWAQKKRSEQKKAIDIVRRLGTIDEMQTEYQSGRSEDGENLQKKANSLSFNRPALDALVGPHTDAGTLKSHKLDNDHRKSRKSLGEKSDAQRSITQIETMFPVPERPPVEIRDSQEETFAARIGKIMA